MPNAAEIHRAVFDAIPSQNFAKLRELYHPDTIYMTGDGAEQQGADFALGAAEAFTTAFPDLTIKLRRQYVPSHDVSIIEYTFSGTHKSELEGIPATGKKIAVIACSVIEVQDGKIVREHDYYDNMALMSQLGLNKTS
jgi:steroid delta-isomerase-like uncharacterized protein